jgi:hypothetical protein
MQNVNLLEETETSTTFGVKFLLNATMFFTQASALSEKVKAADLSRKRKQMQNICTHGDYGGMFIENEMNSLIQAGKEAAAFGNVLITYPNAEKAYQEMLQDISPTTDWYPHDGHQSPSKPGLRLLRSGVAVYPVYMGTKAKSVSYSGIKPIYEHSSHSPNKTRYVGGEPTPDEIYQGSFKQLPQIINYWGQQFR